MSYTNNQVVINSSANNSVTLPAYFDDGSGNPVELNLSDFQINAANVSNIDATDINPSITDMAALVNPNNGLIVTNGLTSVYDGYLAGLNPSPYSGTIAYVNTGSGQDSIAAFRQAYDELTGNQNSGQVIKGINYGSGTYRNNSTPGQPMTNTDSFGIGYDNTVIIGTIMFPNTTIDWNASNGPQITRSGATDSSGNSYPNYLINGTITEDGFSNN
jgi:hypothetical protein